MCVYVCVRECSVMSDSLQPTECSLPGSSVHGIFPARTLEWFAISSSMEEVVHMVVHMVVLFLDIPVLHIKKPRLIEFK